MKNRAAEQRQSCNRWNRWAIQLPDRADHRVAVDRLGCAIAGMERYAPTGSRFVEFRCWNIDSETYVLAQIIFIGRFIDICQNLIPSREVPGPLRVRVERIRVEVVGCIDCTTWIIVLQPGASDIPVLFQDHKRNAEFLEPDTGTQASEPGADDDNLEALDRQSGRIALPMYRASIFVPQAGLFHQQRDILLRNRLTHACAHQLLERLRGYVSRRFAPA